MTAVAWVDGSCLGNPGPGGWAVVFQDGPKPSGGVRRTTNNRMELRAIIEAVRLCPEKEDSIIVYSDSQWAVNVLSGKWKPTKNLDMIAAYRQIQKEGEIRGLKTVELGWVRGHNGQPLNEEADRLAKLAAQDIARINDNPTEQHQSLGYRT